MREPNLSTELRRGSIAFTIRARRLVLMLVATLMILCAPSLAYAGHYELFMRYKLGDKVVDLNLGEVPYLLVESARNDAQGLYIRFVSDSSSAVTMTQLRNVVVLTEINGKQLRPKNFSISKEQDPPKDHLLASATELQLAGKSAYGLRISVLNKFSPGYLCSIEKELVRSEGKPLADPKSELLPYVKFGYLDKKPAAEAPAKPAAKRKPGAKETPAPALSVDVEQATGAELELYKLLSEHGQLGGKPVLFSYCAGGYQKIDWGKLAASEGAKESAAVVEGRHKDALAFKLTAVMAGKMSADVLYQSDGKGRPKNIFIRDSYQTTLVNWLAGDFELFEDTVHPDSVIRRIVDQDSRLVLKPRRRLCSAVSCRGIIDTLRVTVDGKDDAGNAFSDEYKVANRGGHWEIEVALSKYLYKRVELTLWLKTGKLEQQVQSHTIDVENLGLITTAPFVSEVASLMANPALSVADLEIKSTIPLSWAYNLDNPEGRLAAVTFPWMIGFNTRAVPRLADIIKVFPHVTVLLPLARDASTGGEQLVESGKPQLLLGAGVSLVNTFSLAYGAAMTSDARSSFLLGGVSVPDLVNLLQAAGN